ncbi:hypothetical protein PMI35_05505 [Pseudomonas sp. GM78]|uniref:hypothetical protein n=1 Tax=Pseudomonas sp. GM78 TaxID=1144337 RepID=UPI000270BA1F|nr:hypothetical protein [Pseudomonas sp. GM78]EJN20201.1 hypothetical protein PMI35_05505 [Pseudomonas sp. GM78]
MSEKKDIWDLVSIMAGVIGGVLIPTALFYASHSISESEKNNAILQSRAANMMGLIQHLSSSNEKERIIASEVALSMSKNNQLPSELVPTIARFAAHDKNSEVAQVSTQTLINAAKQDSPSQGIAQDAFKGVKPRVYFHIPNDTLKKTAANISKQLQKKSFDNGFEVVVPGIDVRKGPRTNELRFFKDSERNEAMKIQDELKALGVSTKLVDFSSTYENSSNIRPLHFELWYGWEAT